MISAVIITYNEAAHIERCLRSLPKNINDIVVIDAHSDDETANLASDLGAKVFSKKWNGYGSAKNFGNQKATNDWIISIDADEHLDTRLSYELSQLNPKSGIIYCIRRVNFIGERALRWGTLKPEWKSRIFNKYDVKWDDRLIHEQLSVPPSYKLKKIRGDLHHNLSSDLSDFELREDTFALLGAKEWLRSGKSPDFIKKTIGPGFHFVNDYLIKGGFLEGKLGYQLAQMKSKMKRRRLRYYTESLHTNTHTTKKSL